MEDISDMSREELLCEYIKKLERIIILQEELINHYKPSTVELLKQIADN